MIKSKQSTTKLIKTKLNVNYTDKLQRFQLYHQEMFINMNFCLTEKDLLEKTAPVKRFEYSALGKKLKAKTSAAVSKIRHSF